MDNRTSQLVEASFRGVPFRVRSETLTEGGRKIILHEYVNSSERFVEDQGQIPPKFRVTAFVHGTNFKALAQRLETALNQEGSGKLVLPTFGNVTVYALPYSKDSSQQSVGEITFELEFATGRPAAGPIASGVDIQEVYSLGDTARKTIENVFANIFQIPTTVENASVAEFDILTAVDGALATFKDLMPSENLENLEIKVSLINSTISTLTRNPIELAENLFAGSPLDTGIWQENSLGLTGGNGLSNLIGFTEFGSLGSLQLTNINGAIVGESGLPLWPETTNQRISRNINRLAIVNSQQLNSLVGAYEVAAASEYQTQTEISNVRQTLETIHDRIMRIETEDKNIIQSDDGIRKAVEDIRLASLNVLEQKEQEAFTLTDTELKIASSSFVQAFRFYAEDFTSDIDLSDRAISLRKLNPDLPAIALNKDITIFRTT